MEKLKQVIEQVKEYEDNNCFEIKTSVVLHWLKEIENEALAISRVVGRSEQLKCPTCKLDYDKEEIEMFRGLCESCRDRAF